MGTIVLSVIGNSLVSWAEEYLPGRRRLLVASMYAVIIASLIGVGIMYIPRVTHEGAKIIARIQVLIVSSAFGVGSFVVGFACAVNAALIYLTFFFFLCEAEWRPLHSFVWEVSKCSGRASYWSGSLTHELLTTNIYMLDSVQHSPWHLVQCWLFVGDYWDLVEAWECGESLTMI